MSDIEEPPTKVTKIELAVPGTSDGALDSTDHGPEEWLSDEDYNQSMEPVGTLSNIDHTSQDDTTMGSSNNDLENPEDQDLDSQQYTNQAEKGDSQVNTEGSLINSQDEENDQRDDPEDSQSQVDIKNIEIQYEGTGKIKIECEVEDLQSIQIKKEEKFSNTQTEEQTLLNTVEETLNNFENNQSVEKMDDYTDTKTLTEDLGMFLIRKTDGSDTQNENAVEEKQNEDKDDGNDTDELLRMLGEDDNKDKRKKEVLKTVNKKAALASQEQSTDDEANVFQIATKVTQLKVSKNAHVYRKKAPKKAKPQDSDSDMSSNEVKKPVQKTYRVRPVPSKNVRTARKSRPKTPPPNILFRTNLKRVNIPSTPLRVYSNPKLQKKQTLATSKDVKPEVNKVEPKKVEVKREEVVKSPSSQQSKKEVKVLVKQEAVSVVDLDTDGQQEKESDEEQVELKPKALLQQLMKPEEMDEMMLTDEESERSDASFYDEMPTSESEEIEEWFALDIRAERAGDYIPLLGHKAKQLLVEEKKRVGKKLTLLRENIQALSEKSKAQTRQIDEARRSLAELDTLLTHTC